MARSTMRTSEINICIGSVGGERKREGKENKRYRRRWRVTVRDRRVVEQINFISIMNVMAVVRCGGGPRLWVIVDSGKLIPHTHSSAAWNSL